MDLSETGDAQLTRHPWEVARYDFFRRVIQRAPLPAQPRVLDGGAGDGWFAAQLAGALGPGSQVACWDAFYTDAQVAALSAAHPALTFSSAQPDGAFDLLLLLDVLEHVEDDQGFLDQLVAERLDPGAFTLISVPVHPWLFSEHDRLLLHHRRYTPAGVRRIIAASGLTIETSSMLFHSLILPRAAAVARERLTGHRPAQTDAAQWGAGPLVTRAVSTALAIDNGFSRLFERLRLPVPGLSWWALCRKP